jgi:hypothetical protein
MKAREVLRCYAAGERDFRRANLQGQSFQGQDLSGADFSEADIRGANFTNAILRGANFTQAKAGLQGSWLLVQQVFVYLLAALAGSLSHFSSTIIAAPFLNLDSLTGSALFMARVATGGLVAITLIAITSQGFTIKTLRMIVIAVIGVGAFAIAVAIISVSNPLSFIKTAHLIISFAIISAYSATVSSVSLVLSLLLPLSMLLFLVLVLSLVLLLSLLLVRSPFHMLSVHIVLLLLLI